MGHVSVEHAGHVRGHTLLKTKSFKCWEARMKKDRCAGLILVYKILFDLLHANIDDFFTAKSHIQLPVRGQWSPLHVG